jgi:predicted RNA binding protein YcfA (HicA-like mRNA interferase family)
VPGLKPTSGETVIKILSKQYGFVISGQSGSHVRLSKETPNGKVRLSERQELEHRKV